jgi:outer membrane protein assembly factor BamB
MLLFHILQNIPLIKISYFTKIQYHSSYIKKYFICSYFKSCVAATSICDGRELWSET